MSTPNDLNQRCQRLLEAARKHGVHYHLSPVASTEYPNGELKVWSSRTPEGQKIVEVMRNHRAEVAAFLAAHRPALMIVPPEEEAYRHEVHPEEDLRVSELSVSELKAICATVYLDMREAEQAEDDQRRALRTAVR